MTKGQPTPHDTSARAHDVRCACDNTPIKPNIHTSKALEHIFKQIKHSNTCKHGYDCQHNTKPDALLLAPPDITPNPPPMEPASQTRGRTQERPKEKHSNLGEQRWAASTHASRVEAPDKSSDDGDESDTGPAALWDPHTGLKPSELDGEASDGDIDIKDDLPYGAAFEVNDAMIEMIIKLEDTRDSDWLPPAEQKKLAKLKKGD